MYIINISTSLGRTEISITLMIQLSIKLFRISVLTPLGNAEIVI